MIIIESERLYLRTITEHDIADLHNRIFSNEEVVRHTFGSEISDISDTKSFIDKQGNFDGQYGLSALIERESDTIIGLAGVLQCNYLEQPDYEIGFILATQFWGKGYAKEIGQAQIDFIKKETSANRVLAIAGSENHGSIKTIKSLGLNYLTTINVKDRGERQVFMAAINR